MATLCDKLLANDISRPCTETMQKGIERRGVIINRADIDFSAIVRDTEDPLHIVKTLPLLRGKRGFEIVQESKTPFGGTKTEMESGNFGNSFKHEVSFMLVDNGPECAKVAEALASGEYVVILENKAKKLTHAKKGVGAFQIYGLSVGLKASAASREAWSDDTNGGWTFTLEETGATTAAEYLWNTGLNETKTAFETYLTAKN